MAYEYTRENVPQPTYIDTDRIRTLHDMPEGLAEALDAYDVAWAAYDEADLAREDAEAEILDAEHRDGVALKTALMAGKGDPGTKATDASHRAATVAQVKLQICRDSLQAAMDPLWKLIKANPEVLSAAAEVELAHLEAYAKLAGETFDLIDQMITAARDIGITYDTVSAFLSNQPGARLNPVWPNLADATYSGASVADWYRTQLLRLAETDAAAAKAAHA